MSKIVALIQARMSSSRFPGKVIETIDGMPMIAFMVARVMRARSLDRVAVVTSVDVSDDPLVAVLNERGIDVFRGDLEDVLGRYAAAAKRYDADIIVRLTGDCPLSDPAIIDAVVARLVETSCDYASNTSPPSFADGLDVEVFTRPALARAAASATAAADREHVTLWMRSEVAALDQRCVTGLIDSSHLRITVDHPDDLETVRGLVDHLGDASGTFDHYDILRCLDRNRDLIELNPHARNEGLKASLSAAQA